MLYLLGGGRPCLLSVLVVWGSIAQQLAHLCHLLLVNLGKFLPISELVSMSVKERCLICERKEIQWKMCGSQHRVGA